MKTPKQRAEAFAKRFARGNFLMEEVYAEVWMAGYNESRKELTVVRANRDALAEEIDALLMQKRTTQRTEPGT